MVELAILLHFLTKDAYTHYHEYIDLEYIRDTSPETYYLYKALDLYYKEHPDTLELTPNTLLIYTFTQFPALKENDCESIKSSVDEMKQIEPGLIIDLLEKYKEKALATKIIQEAVLVVGGKKPFSVITELVGHQDKPIVVSENDDLLVDMDLSNLINKTYNPDGLSWPILCLNKAMGPLTKGRFGFVFARPNAGKTTFLAHTIMHMAKQLTIEDDGTGGILWCNNEEQGEAVGARCFQAYFGATSKELLDDPGKFNSLWINDDMPKKFKLYDDAAMTKSSIEKRLARHKPKLIVLDQIDKIAGFKADRHDLLLKMIYQWARELSKKYGPVIAVCQAGATGENKKWLDYTDVDSSHTAKQGEADFIIGIGKLNDEGQAYSRFISISKNKLPPGVDTLEEYRHGRFYTTIEPTIARYFDTRKDY